ncbi:MAG: hypothetical protein NUK62_03515 [Tenericutes bacterium]|nr:hypothetical protein [Mycoplasmatota bacterium]
MKLNPKVYKQLTGEPFETQEINGKNIEFHYMNDTPFLFQFASKGRFAIWTSDGNDYKVLIETKYYDVMKDFYQKEVNMIWLSFLERVGAISKKINMMFIIPTLIFYVLIAIVSTLLFPELMLQILLFMIVIVVISNMFQGRIVNKRVREENKLAQDQIREYLGTEEFDELVKAQEEHYKEYFKFNVDEEETNDGTSTEDKIENTENSEDEDGTKSN